jgi:replicative DNA helicase
MTDQTMTQPKGREQEAALIGAVLRRPSAFVECAEITKPADFGWKAYGAAWAAMGKLQEQGLRIDTITVGDELDRAGALADWQMHDAAQFQGRAALSELRQMAASGESAVSYAQKVKDYSAKREILHHLNTGAEWCGNGRYANDILSDLTRRLESVTTPGKMAATTISLAEVAEQEYAHIYEAAEKEPDVIQTGWGDLDQLFSGFEAPDFTVVAALPGQGKTAFLVSLNKNIYDRYPQKKVMIFTLEMSAAQWYRRLVSAEAGISYKSQKTGRLSADEWERYNAAYDEMKWRSNIFINDLPGINPAQMRQEMRRVQPDLVMVDYLQLMTSSERTDKRHEQVASVARAIKNTAKEFSIPMLCAAQLNRESVKNDRPRLQHLAESAELERASDNVFFLHKPDELSNETEIILAKCRNGQTGTRKLLFMPSRTRFESIAPNR